MTDYYYLASDRQLPEGNGSLELWETDEVDVPGMDFPVQREICNGVSKAWQLRELHQYLANLMNHHETCTVQMVHLLNSNLAELVVKENKQLLWGELMDPKQLLLNEGQMLTIRKGKILN